MKLLLTLILLSSWTSAFAECENAKLNSTDTIYEGYVCTVTNIKGAKKVNDLCIIKAKTALEDEESFNYTHMQTRVSGESGWKDKFSTFKWHHKKNNSVSKMWEDSKHIKMKDVTAVDFMKSNVYKVSELDKESKVLEIEVYKKKALIGLRKRKMYSASFKCRKF